MGPLVHTRIFEIEHDAGSTGVQHLDAEVAVIGGAGHLIALVLAPIGQGDLPSVADGVGREVVRRFLAFERALQAYKSFRCEFLLSWRKSAMQGKEEIQEPRRKI